MSWNALIISKICLKLDSTTEDLRLNNIDSQRPEAKLNTLLQLHFHVKILCY